MFIEIDMKAAIRCYLEGKTVYEVKESGSVEKLSVNKPLKGSRFIIDNRQPAVTIDKSRLYEYTRFLELVGWIALTGKPLKIKNFMEALDTIRRILKENNTVDDVEKEIYNELSLHSPNDMYWPLEQNKDIYTKTLFMFHAFVSGNGAIF